MQKVSINQNGIFIHRTVTHKCHFVDPITGAHIQNVESYNNKLRFKIKMAKRGNIFLCRHHYGLNLIGCLFLIL